MTYSSDSQTLRRTVVEKEVKAIHGRGSPTTLPCFPIYFLVLHRTDMDEAAQNTQPGSHRQPWGGLLGNNGFRFLSLVPEGIAGLGESRHGRVGYSFSGLVPLNFLTLGV